MESYEENNPSDFSLDEVISKIKIFDDKITKSDIKFLYHGSYNVYGLKEDFMIKIPSKVLIEMFGTDLMSKEVRKLRYLNDKLDVRIPVPLFTSEDQNNLFYIYKKIPGISLSRIFKKISKEILTGIGAQIGEIASNIHLLPKKFPEIKTELQFNTTYEKYIESIVTLYEKARKQVFPILNKKENTWIDNLFNSFFEIEKTTKIDLVTTHNDFDTSNILINPQEDYKVSGIIDFEEFGLGDPAVDLLFQEEGKKFHQAVLSSYSGSNKNGLQQRMDFHKKKGCLYYILTGLDHNLPKMVSHGKEMLEIRMKGYDY
jgi:aminoglycoside phosphotransferase